MNAAGSNRKLGQSRFRSSPPVLDNQIRVSTPENIAFQYEISGPSRRLMAYLADVVITTSVFGVVVIATMILFSFAYAFARNTALAVLMDLLVQLAFGIFLVLGFLLHWFYGAYMETNHNGQTFGKMLAKIRTIATNGSAIDGTQATLRNFFRLLDVSPIISLGLIFGPEAGYAPVLPVFGFGLICMAISPKYQRIGDFVADTMVVTEDKQWTHGLAKFQDPRIPQLAELLPDSFVVTPGMAEALAEYVDRRRFLSQQSAEEIAKHLGVPLIKKFGLAQNTNMDLLLCALYYKTFMDHKDDENLDRFSLNARKNPQQDDDANSENPFLQSGSPAEREDTP